MTGDIRSATGGKGSFFVKSQTFEQLPREHQENIIKQIRQRKGFLSNGNLTQNSSFRLRRKEIDNRGLRNANFIGD